MLKQQSVNTVIANTNDTVVICNNHTNNKLYIDSNICYTDIATVIREKCSVTTGGQLTQNSFM